MKSVYKIRKTIITWRFIASEFIDFMVSSKHISASHRLKCLLDTFFLLGILQTNSVVAAVEVQILFDFSYSVFQVL